LQQIREKNSPYHADIQETIAKIGEGPSDSGKSGAPESKTPDVWNSVPSFISPTQPPRGLPLQMYPVVADGPSSAPVGFSYDP
jgi:hypothetical protein